MKRPIETQDSREILNLIRRHNRWRRADKSLEMVNPTELGHALDEVCNMVETQLRMIDMLHDQLTKALEAVVRKHGERIDNGAGKR